jgi:hypothetical protein
MQRLEAPRDKPRLSSVQAALGYLRQARIACCRPVTQSKAQGCTAAEVSEKRALHDAVHERLGQQALGPAQQHVRVAHKRFDLHPERELLRTQRACVSSIDQGRPAHAYACHAPERSAAPPLPGSRAHIPLHWAGRLCSWVRHAKYASEQGTHAAAHARSSQPRRNAQTVRQSALPPPRTNEPGRKYGWPWCCLASAGLHNNCCAPGTRRTLPRTAAAPAWTLRRTRLWGRQSPAAGSAAAAAAASGAAPAWAQGPGTRPRPSPALARRPRRNRALGRHPLPLSDQRCNQECTCAARALSRGTWHHNGTSEV